MTRTPVRLSPSAAAVAAAKSPAAGNVVSLHRHPAFLRRKIARDARKALDQVADAREKLDRVYTALALFRAQLAESRARLAPTRADCAATLAALDSGDVTEMERVRDAILTRTQAERQARAGRHP